MSRSPKRSRLPTLVAKADSPATEIVVYDGQFLPVAKSLGRLTIALPQGIYKVSFRAGTALHEELAVLRAGEPPLNIQVAQKEMTFASPVPIRKTVTTREMHRIPASAISTSKPLSHGRGSRLFVFARDLDYPLKENALTGVSILDVEGNELTTHGIAAISKNNSKGYAGLHLELNPGTYRMRVEIGPNQRIEQSIVTCADWQTQVFLLRQPVGLKSTHRKWSQLRRPDVVNASVLMSRRGFDPDIEQGIRLHGSTWKSEGQLMRLAEQARLGLAESRWVVPDEMLNGLLFAKYESPMLGIYGAHLLLRRLQREAAAPRLAGARRRNEDGWKLLRKVASRLRKLVGEHPDVEALYCAMPDADKRGPRMEFSAPPMLRSSWQAVLNASAGEPSLVPLGSLAADVAEHMRSCGPWLAWLHQDAKKTIPTASGSGHRVTFEDVYRQATETWTARSDTPQPQASSVAPRLSETESRIYEYFSDLAKLALAQGLSAVAASTTGQSLVTSLLAPDKVIEFIRLPAAVLAASLQSLSTKVPSKIERSAMSPSTWPPRSGTRYVQSEAFGKLMLEVASTLTSRYPHMDFEDGVAHVYDWLDRKLEADSAFINHQRFATNAAFRAYLRQALWNAARLAQRKRKREESVGELSLDEPLSAKELSPEEAATWAERIEKLPSKERRILTSLVFDEMGVSEIAAQMRISEAVVTRHFEAAVDHLAATDASIPPPKKRRRVVRKSKPPARAARRPSNRNA